MYNITVQTEEKKFPAAPDLYGLFFEDINRSGDGGLFPEMIRNRSFEDSLPPKRVTVSRDRSFFQTPEGFTLPFCHGEGTANWVRKNQIPYTPIPGWYGEAAVMKLECENTLNSKREAALLVEFSEGGSIYNTGYMGMKQVAGEKYDFLMFAGADRPVRLIVSLSGADGTEYARKEFAIRENAYCRYEATLTASGDDTGARLVFTAPEGGRVKFGFTSLKPADTYNGHGLRRDLVEKLKALNPQFLRFPGGCIVEGFTRETAMRFPNTIGPEWERPSHGLMWHYRTTNGLGFHEYLQLCEDLGAKAMYVFNCGITCQGRFPELFCEDEVDTLIQETLDAIAYAIDPADSPWGRKRAEAGHEAPFDLHYIEIGNENFGPDYLARYQKCYAALKEKYPNLIYISNTHTEAAGLPTEIVDEHFYDTPEFFAEACSRYDSYDRSGPGIFVGEFAVTAGAPESLYAALGEAMFMVGLERNQDVVKLASYAPLLANPHYVSWTPDLIFFDNNGSYCIPSYYVWKIFGRFRGDTVVASQDDSPRLFFPVRGLPAVMGDVGVKWREAAWNGYSIQPSHAILGAAEFRDGVWTTIPGEPVGVHPYRAGQLRAKTFVALGEDELATEGVFEIELFAEEGRELVLGLFCKKGEPAVHWTNHSADPQPWSLADVLPFQWVIRDGKSCVMYGRLGRERMISQPVCVDVNYGSFNQFRAELSARNMLLSVNGKQIADVLVPQYPAAACVASETGEEVIIKIVNMAAGAEEVQITLDCDVEPEYTAHILTGDPIGKNSFRQPERIRDVSLQKTGASRRFMYAMPGSSVNVLVLKKKH